LLWETKIRYVLVSLYTLKTDSFGARGISTSLAGSEQYKSRKNTLMVETITLHFPLEVGTNTNMYQEIISLELGLQNHPYHMGHALKNNCNQEREG
jgi:hypothetical protein